MIQTLEDKLKPFKSCFSREVAFKWLVIIVVAFMRRSDFLGITSVIRDVMPDGGCYESMLHFFYSNAWSLKSLRLKWYLVVSNSGLILKRCSRFVRTGDGVKTLKEARSMPGIRGFLKGTAYPGTYVRCCRNSSRRARKTLPSAENQYSGRY